MLPNIRLSGNANDSIGDYLAASSASVSRAATLVSPATTNSFKSNSAATTATSFATVNRSFAASVSSLGWGQLPSSSFASTVGSGQPRTLAEHVKESTGWQQKPNVSSMPWVAAAKTPTEQQQNNMLQQHSVALVSAASLISSNNFSDNTNAMGSWNSPETSSNPRSGWNADGSMKSDGVPDDGTAIWGNPSTKKSGIDWAEKESLSNPPKIVNNSEKRIQKPEPVISSLNGTEAWGAPATTGLNASSNGGIGKTNNSQQLANLSENSGNNYVGKTSTINNEPLSWGETSSLQKVTRDGNSSPTSDSVWDHLTSNDEKDSERKTSSDWLTAGVNSNSSSSNRLDELKRLAFQGGSLFEKELTLSASKSVISKTMNLDNNNGRQTSMIGETNGAGAVGASLVGNGGSTNNSLNDLKQQMSSNYPNHPLDSSPSRQSPASALASSNQAQSQLNPYSLGITPSRELLKQMVHQIQLAVQAGHLNAHIMNQPLSTPTLQLVYTLLQQIKLLQQFQEIRTQTVNKSSDIANNMAQQSNLDLQITRVQQNISLLQKAITQQQAALTKNESIVESNLKKQQAASNSYNNSYANMSKLSTNMKVPSNDTNMSNSISNSNNIDSFRRSSLIDTLSNNSSDQLRSEAQARFEANANLDKNLSPLLQTSSSLNNILNKLPQNDFSKAQSFNQTANQQNKANLLSANQASTSPAAAAWLAFTQGEMVNSQSTNSGVGNWSRSPSNDQHQLNGDLLSELSAAKAWRGNSFLSTESRENQASMTSGMNMSRHDSSSSVMKQTNENDLLMNRDPSLFYDWNSSDQNSDSQKRNFDSGSSSSSFSAIGSLSLQSNPWLFAPTSNSLNIGSSGFDNLIGNSKNAKNKSDNGNIDKIRVSGDQLGFLNSNSATNNSSQRPLYDWSDMSSAASSLQFNNDSSPTVSNKSAATSSSGSNAQVTRPGPPPGLRNNLGLIGSSFTDGMSSHSESDGSKQQSVNNENQQMKSSSLWSGAWFD